MKSNLSKLSLKLPSAIIFWFLGVKRFFLTYKDQGSLEFEVPIIVCPKMEWSLPLIWIVSIFDLGKEKSSDIDWVNVFKDHWRHTWRLNVTYEFFGSLQLTRGIGRFSRLLLGKLERYVVEEHGEPMNVAEENHKNNKFLNPDQGLQKVFAKKY